MKVKATQKEIERARHSLLNAGWVYAEAGMPGLYVPGPEIRQPSLNAALSDSKEVIRNIVNEFSNDPELILLYQFANEEHRQ